MGAVYRALDRTSGELVALKIVRGEQPAQVERFAREAATLADLRHPAIVRYIAHGATGDGDEHYLAMEWLDGESVSERLRSSGLNIPDTVILGAKVARGLHAAHQQGVIHRDIKP